MNINFNTFNKGINKTGSLTGTSNVGRSEVSPSQTGKIKADVISISSDASEYSGIVKIRSSVSSGVNECGSAEKIASLKNVIANGSYEVSSKAVAGKILDRFV